MAATKTKKARLIAGNYLFFVLQENDEKEDAWALGAKCDIWRSSHSTSCNNTERIDLSSRLPTLNIDGILTELMNKT